MPWVDGFILLGESNARTAYGIGASIYAVGSGVTNNSFAFFNIGATAYAVVFPTDGSIVVVNVATQAVTLIAPSGTIQSGQSPYAFQWGRQYLIIVAPQTNGYWIWDGTVFYSAGGIGPTNSALVANGSGYTSVPSYTVYGGSGSGVTLNPVIANGEVISLTVTNAGSGFLGTDVIQVAFHGGGSDTGPIVTSTVVGGVVTGLTIVAAGTNLQALPTVTFAGGGGSGATATLTMSVGALTGYSITNGGTDYTTAPSVILTPDNNAAAAIIYPMPLGISGTAGETFDGRVWVANNATLYYSAPGSIADFGAGGGGGSTISSDSFLRVQYTSLRQSNGFLYIHGDSSMNYISGVNTAGSPPVTTFNDQNVDPQIGTPWRDTVQVFSRNIVFANPFGVYVSYGGAVTKISSPLDGIYNTVANFGGFSPSSAVAQIFGIQVYMLLLPIIDPYTGVQANKLLMWDGKKWWACSQEVSLTFIGTQEINSVLTAWGTDGVNLYPLFQNPSSAIQKVIQSKLWSVPAYYFLKTAVDVTGLLQFYDNTGTVAIAVDSDQGSQAVASGVGPNGLTWTNNAGQPITWTNNSNATLSWASPGVVWFLERASGQGVVMGLTVTTFAPDLAIISMTLIVQNYQSLF